MEITQIARFAHMASGKVFHLENYEEGENGTFNHVDGPDKKEYWEAMADGDELDHIENRIVGSYTV